MTLRNFNPWPVIPALCVMVSIFSGRDALAQAAGQEGVAIRSLELSKTRAPAFSYSDMVSEASITVADWAKILVRFDTAAEWTDQLEMRFYIVVKNPKKAVQTMLIGKYVYSDIPKGVNHMVAVYLRPRTMDRFGNVIDQMAVEMCLQGEIVAVKTVPASDKAWWRSAAMHSVEGYLLDHSQTPFAHIAESNYEQPKLKAYP
jgi:hypothetical protein